MVSTYVTKTTKNERAYVKPPRKCSKCKRREIQRNNDKKAIVCQSEAFPVFKHCLRNNLKDYVPKQYLIVTAVNLSNPRMQQEGCPQYRPDEPVRMPLGFKR